MLDHFVSCPYCKAKLPPNASFCPYCARSIHPRREIVSPPYIWKRILHRVLPVFLLFLLAGIGTIGYLSFQPQVYDHTGEIVYTDQDRTYRLMLTDSKHPWESLHQTQHNAAIKEPYRTPTLLYIMDADNGTDAGPEFLEKVVRVTAEFPTLSGGGSTVACTAPAPHDAFPDAALVSLTDFTAESDFTSQMVWTIDMKNGDTIRLRQNLSITAIRTYDYYPADAPMNTAQELQTLVDTLSNSLEPNAVINLYLPAVTYMESLTIRTRSINLYGTTDGEQRTTFAAPIQYQTEADHQISYVQDIVFLGEGTGTALSASARVRAIHCTFTNWNIGFGGSAWINAESCTFENNQIGLYFNCGSGSVSHTMYNHNQFWNNRTAVVLESVPTDITLDFQGCVFSGNGTNFDNRCGQPIDVSQTVFS